MTSRDTAKPSDWGAFQRLVKRERSLVGSTFNYGTFRSLTCVFSRSLDGMVEHVLRACAEQGGKILTLHSVRAVSKVLGHLERSLPQGRGRAILHWFTGTPAEARRAVAMGCYFSINGKMLQSAKHRQLVESLPLDRLLTETDGPFVEQGGKPMRPRAVATTVADLAALHGRTVDETAGLILENLKHLVSESA